LAGDVPERSRVEISREAGRLRIVLRVARAWSTITILAVWLLGWGAGEVAAASQLLGGPNPAGASVFLALWLAAWTMGGLLAAGSLAWSLAGREVIMVEGPSLAIRHEVAGVGRTRTFEVRRIQALRPAQPGDQLPADRRGRRARRGAIAFEVDGAPHRLGLTLEGHDVEAVLQALHGAGVARATGGFG